MAKGANTFSQNSNWLSNNQKFNESQGNNQFKNKSAFETQNTTGNVAAFQDGQKTFKKSNS